MNEMIRTLTKQLQLLEIELGDYAAAKKAKRISIHPEMYYVKLAHVRKGLNRAVAILKSLEKDMYENYKFTKH